MDYIISEDELKKISKALNEPYCFETDGCDCGDFIVQLGENIYLSIYRSCRRSSSTPDDMQWKIHEPELVSKGKDEDDYDVFNSIKDLKIDEEQQKQIILLARIRTIKDNGYDEYGQEMNFDEEPNLDKWDELKEYLTSEKDKIENSADIPHSIYESILNKMEKLQEE